MGGVDNDNDDGDSVQLLRPEAVASSLAPPPARMQMHPEVNKIFRNVTGDVCMPTAFYAPRSIQVCGRSARLGLFASSRRRCSVLVCQWGV